jgi:hypothetical protein
MKEPASTGWRADPTQRHQERYFVAGQPIDLVRDDGTESVDAMGEDHPATATPRPQALSATDAAPSPAPPPPKPVVLQPVGAATQRLHEVPIPPPLSSMAPTSPPGSPPTLIGPPTPGSGEPGVVKEGGDASSNRVPLGIVGVAVAVVVLVGGAALLFRPTPEKTYLGNLTTSGSLGVFNGDASAIAAGRKTCADIESGVRKPQGSAVDQIAVDAFCPTFAPEFKVLQTVTVEGTFLLSDASSRYSNGISTTGSGCEGDGGYGDINASTQAILKNQDGKELDRADLGPGKGTSTVCTFTFRLDVTEGERTYVLSVGHRGESTYTWDEIKKPGAIGLSLGL